MQSGGGRAQLVRYAIRVDLHVKIGNLSGWELYLTSGPDIYGFCDLAYHILLLAS